MRPPPTELWRWTATDLASGIRTRLISSVEATRACLHRIEQFNPSLNAFATVQADAAIAAAESADMAVSSGAELGPLHGVPTAIKINSHLAGLATTDGIAAFGSVIANTDSPQVATLRRAGAVLIGQTNVPPFSFRWFTHSEPHGRTLNPWNAHRTPGGSSGGTSAAVAAQMVPIGLANDIAGSIRYPAYACGLPGLRPTLGRTASWYGPEDGDQMLPVQLLAVQGVIAHTIDDIALGLRVMAQDDPRDPSFVSAPRDCRPHARPIKVGVLRDAGLRAPDAAVNDALDQAAQQLSEAGYWVEEVDLQEFQEAYRLWFRIVIEALRPNIQAMEQLGGQALERSVGYLVNVADELWPEPVTVASYIEALTRRGTLISRIRRFMVDCPLLLMPTSAEQAFEQDADIASLERARMMMAAQWPQLAVPVLGFPAISVPMGIANGLPTGVQILGDRFREDMVLDTAKVLEARVGRLTPPDFS